MGEQKNSGTCISWNNTQQCKGVNCDAQNHLGQALWEEKPVSDGTILTPFT